MKKLKRFFASILCICMIITSCPDLLAWAAGDTAVVKPVTYRLTANSLSKMVRKAELEKTEENGLCKLKLPKGFNKTLGKTKLHVYLQPDEDSLVFVFENKADKRQGAALIVDNRKSDIFAIPTKAEIYEELGYEYASDSNADEDEIDSEGLLGDDFQDLEAEIVDDAATGSDNNADEKYDYLEGYATYTILNNKKHTAGVAFTVSLDELGMDSLGELLPEEEDEDEITATDSNAEETAPSVPEEIPTVTPPEVIEATPSDAIPVTVATPSNVAKTFIAEVGGVTIRAHAEAGVLPDEAIFEAIELKEAGDTADAYKEACETLDADEETVYDGVMAYDLHFLLNGEEVQPDGEVQITMEVSKEALPEEADPESVEVKHLEEDGDNLTVQTVADTEDVAEGTVELKDDESVTAEFAVQSFSYFTITYKEQHSFYAHLYNYDKEKNTYTEIGDTNTELKVSSKYNPGDFGSIHDSGTGSEKRQNKWISIEAVAGTFGSVTEGYTYDSAHKGTVSGNKIVWIYYSTDAKGWYYSDGEKQPDEATKPVAYEWVGSRYGGSWQWVTKNGYGKIDDNSTVCLIYIQNLIISSEIEDEIKSNGRFAVYYPNEVGLTYEWLGSDDGKKWEVVKQRTIAGTAKNIENDGNGSYLYPALDLSPNLKSNESIRRWYKVNIYKNNELVKEYDKKQVPYYAALQNGSFENPDSNKVNQNGNFTFPNGTVGLEWKTTGSDKQVEIVKGIYGSAHGITAVKNDPLPHGDQFAELNAQDAGALYQNVLTAPGSQLYWDFYHRGRAGVDTMALVIAPTKGVENITEQKDLEGLIENIKANPQAYPGYYVLDDITDGKDAWGEHTSGANGYEVPSGQYLTTFFFVARATHTNDKTIGNLLDKVSFSTELPPPTPGNGYLRVIKNVSQINEEDLGNYTVEIQVGKMGGSNILQTKTIKFSNDTGEAVFELPSETLYWVKEVPHENTGNYTLKTSLVHTDTEPTDVDCTTDQKVEGVLVEVGETRQVVFTNNYYSKYVDVTVRKSVEGNMASRTEDFSFTIEVTDPDNHPVSVEGTYDGKKVGLNGEFSLKAGESIDIKDKIPYGSSVIIRENDYSGDGYKTTHINDYCSDDDGNVCNITKAEKDYKVEFINTRNTVIPTGLFDNGHPTGWLYLMAAAAGCFAFGFYRRRKKKLENGEECL